MRTGPLLDFMLKREQIRLRKEAGLPWPWTDDPILQEYKFTNVKRAHDRTTRELKHDFYDKYREAAAEIQLLNCAIFRYFGTIEFATALGWSWGFNDLYADLIKELAAGRLARKKRVFTGAYVITNQGIKAPKEQVVVDIFIAGVWKAARRIAAVARETGSWRATIEELQKVKGFGGTGFMAKEVVLDTMLTSFWKEPPTDTNLWCPAGPGARRGINRLLGRELNVSMTTRGAVQHMLDIFKDVRDGWPDNWVELELHDIQFQLCEFDKYERVRLGQGRPRCRYRRPI